MATVVSGQKRTATDGFKFPPKARAKFNMREVNKTIGMTPRVERLKKMLLDVKPAVCGERAWYMLESFKETEGLHECRRRALALNNTLTKIGIAIRDGELLVGAPTRHIRGAHPCVETAPLHLEHLLKHPEITTASTHKAATIDEDDRQKLLAACEYWKDRYPGRLVAEKFDNYGDGLPKKWLKAGLYMAGGGVYIPLVVGVDFETLLAKGAGGLIKDAQEHKAKILRKNRADFTQEDREKLEFLESAILCCEGLVTYARRHAALAREMAAQESDPARKADLEKIAAVCEWVPEHPARTFHEALQSTFFVAVGHDIEKAMPNHMVGRFDQYMWPFYERDIKEGRITRQEAAELLGCMFIKWATFEPFLFNGLIGDRRHQKLAQGNYMVNVTLGGVNTTGQDASNELSCLTLHVCAQVRLHQPHVSVRWHRGAAPEFTRKALECARDHGAGIPAFFNDRLGVEYMIDRGLPYEHARDWAMAGCINTSYPRNFISTWWGGGFVNHPKLLELALNDGVDPRTGMKVGAATGDPREFKTFDDVLNAYLKQVDYWYDFNWAAVSSVRKLYKSLMYYMPFTSAFAEGCIEKGMDLSRGGSMYPNMQTSAFIDRGLTDVGDSLMALKKVVFADDAATMSEVIDALQADFEGYDELRKKLKEAPKFGNDIDEVDDIVAYIWDYCKYKALGLRDDEGRQPILFRQGAAWSTWAGSFIDALPNGKKAKAPLADASASPSHGCDLKGPTAVMNSVVKLDPMYMQGPLLNLKFAPGVLRTKEGMQKFEELTGTYMDQGGFHIQYNVLDKATLIDAKKNPEKYRDLVVRLAGYSILFAEASPEVQDEIISRTEHDL